MIAPQHSTIRVLVIAAVHEARPTAPPSLAVEYVEQDLTRDSAERGYDVGFSDLPRQRLEHQETRTLSSRECVDHGTGGGRGTRCRPPRDSASDSAPYSLVSPRAKMDAT